MLKNIINLYDKLEKNGYYTLFDNVKNDYMCKDRKDKITLVKEDDTLNIVFYKSPCRLGREEALCLYRKKCSNCKIDKKIINGFL